MVLDGRLDYESIRNRFRSHRYARYISWTLRLMVFVILTMIMFSIPSITWNNTLEYPELKYLKMSLSENPKCEVPVTDPWDKSILKYYSKPEPLNCVPVQPQVVKFADGILMFNYRLAADLNCRVSQILHNEGVSDNEPLVLESEEIDFGIRGYEVYIDYDAFQVKCYTKGFLPREVFNMNYAQIRMGAHDKVKVDNKEYFIEEANTNYPSVLMIGLDSMSRGNFIRQLPQTHRIMKHMGFRDMLGYVKVGDNTYANLIAVLTGKRGVTTPEYKAEIDENWHISFDNYSFIWKDFARSGYATMFAEDRPDIGTFNYFGWLEGFKHQPTLHYLRPFWKASEYTMTSRRSSAFCYDTRPKHRIQLDYISSFITAYENKRFFGLSWMQDMSHDYLNLIGSADQDFVDFFDRHKDILERSIIIVFSDHGHRYDSIRETVVGRLESRLPFISIRIPKIISWKFKTVPQALQINSKKMTTPFDLHETLLDIARGTFKKGLYRELKTDVRGHSMLGPMPAERTCHEAHIPVEYCPCFKEVSIPISEGTEAANKFAGFLNEMIANSPPDHQSFQCAPLEVESIEYVSVRMPPATVIVDPRVGNKHVSQGIEASYRVQLRMKPPSKAVIEGVVSRNVHTGEWSFSGEVERNNKYGNTSECISDRTMKKICHCIRK